MNIKNLEFWRYIWTLSVYSWNLKLWIRLDNTLKYEMSIKKRMKESALGLSTFRDWGAEKTVGKNLTRN